MTPLGLIQMYDGSAFPAWVFGAAFVLLVVLSLVMLFVARYQRCGPNEILVISGSVGKGQSARCINGGGAFVIPVIQQYDRLPLQPMKIPIQLVDALSFENIRVRVPSVVTVAIGTKPDEQMNAATRLLGLTMKEIETQAGEIIFGQMRQVIASMRIEEINRDRDTFQKNIQEALDHELKKIGLVILNVNVQDLSDESGYVEAIGRKATAEAVQKARGDVADQERSGELRVAQAERDRTIGVQEAQREQAVRVAELQKERTIGEQTAALQRDAAVKEAQRTTAIRIAELAKEQRIGEETAQLEANARVKEAEQNTRVAVANANARAIEGEATASAAVAAANATLRVSEAEAYQRAETRKREAEASVVEAENNAQARAALAQASRVEAEERARLEAPAKAQKARTIVEAEAEAEQQKISARAEAEANYARLEAEARGQYEILAKKGEGLERIVQAAGGSKEAFQLLLLEHIDGLAKTAAEAISNIKIDKVVVWDGGNGNSTANFIQGMAQSLPPMMSVLREVGGVELPSFLGTLAKEAGSREGVVEAANGRPSGGGSEVSPIHASETSVSADGGDARAPATAKPHSDRL
jgi:flotillin